MPAKYSPRVSKAEMHARIDDLIALHEKRESPEQIADKWTARKGSSVNKTYVDTCYSLTANRLMLLHDFVADHTWCKIIWGLRSGTRMEEGE